MSKGITTAVVIIVAIAVIGGVLWWMSSNQVPATTTQTSMSASGTPSPSPASPTPAAADNSDQSINQDMTNVNTQMNAFTSDSASINQGMNDTPVQQQQL
jgi:hypothetical protein